MNQKAMTGMQPPTATSQCGSFDRPEKAKIAVTKDTVHVFIWVLLPAIRVTMA